MNPRQPAARQETLRSAAQRSQAKAAVRGLAVPLAVLLLGVSVTLIAWRWTRDRVERIDRERFQSNAQDVISSLEQRLRDLPPAGLAVDRDGLAASIRQLDLQSEYPDFEIEVFDGEAPSAEHRLYASTRTSSHAGPEHNFYTVAPIALAGRTGTIRVSGIRGVRFSSSEAPQPLAVLLIGFFCSALVFTMLYALVTSQTRAARLARQMTADLRLSEERFRLLAKATNDAIWDWDPVREAVWWSEGVTALFGYPSDAVEPSFGWWESRVHPDDRDRVVTSLRSALENQSAFWCEEYRFHCHDGADTFVIHRGHIVRDAGGRPVRVIGSMMDITDRRRAEEALDEANRAQRTLIETSPLAIITLDREGRVKVWNHAAQRMFGWSEPEVLGHPLPIVPDEERASSDEMLRAELAGKTSHDIELRRLRKDGTFIDISLSSSAIRDAEGRIIGTMSIIADISERHWLEEQRRKHAHTIEEANCELVQQQQVMHSLLEDLQGAKESLETQKGSLQEANRRLEELAMLKDEFVANVSHELRTPLTAIKEGISLMLDDALGEINEEQRDFLATVDENIERLTELISNMLDLSKIEAGRLRLMRRRLPISELIDKTIAGYKALAGRRAVTASLGEPVDVFADPNRILQVLGNLFSNAVKFSRDDGAIHLSVERANGAVAVSVQDNGAGIAPEDAPKLFRKFSQVGEGQNRKGGTGLGLALCKELVEMHGGTIHVSPAPGHGSRFTFTLPAYDPRMALETSFREQQELAKRSEETCVGVIAVDAADMMRLPAAEASAGSRGALDAAAALVRKHVHRGDVVLEIEPSSVAIVAVANADGVQAIIGRLRTALINELADQVGRAAEPALAFGVAIYPMDGEDPHALLALALAAARAGGQLSSARGVRQTRSGG